MARHLSRLLGLAALALSAGCGGAPPSSDQKTWNPNLVEFEFSGLVDPASGRLQLRAAPQPAFGVIPEDADGNALTAAPGTVQVYGPTMTFTDTRPAACGNSSAPHYMTANVGVLSGFTGQQVRNVYVRLDTVSGGQSFCATNVASTNFTGSAALSPNRGLYWYEPLDFGSAVAAGNLIASAPGRTVAWAMNLPDNGTFWFSGKLMAEVIPLPPTITTVPANVNGLIDVPGNGQIDLSVGWANDPLADGASSDGNHVARPTNLGSSMSLYVCGPKSAGFNAMTCSGAPIHTETISGAVGKYVVGAKTHPSAHPNWYLVTVNAFHKLPGDPSSTNHVLTSNLPFNVQ